MSRRDDYYEMSIDCNYEVVDPAIKIVKDIERKLDVLKVIINDRTV